ncbi:MAG: VWA domain-containing protein [Acidobacteriota bacterium]
MREFIKIYSFIVAIMGILTLSLISGQTKKGEEAQRVLKYDAAAVIKLVAVRVLDKDGRPVSDLQKEDFILYDNNELKTITHLEIHTIIETGMEVRSASKVSTLGKAVKGMNRRIFIFLDLQGSDPTGIANAKNAALHFIDTQLRSGDEVGIIGFSPMRGFFIQQYLTTDHKKIRKAIEKTKELPPSKGFISGAELDDSVPDRAGHKDIQSKGQDTGGEVMSSFGMGDRSIYVPGTSSFQRLDFVPRMSDLAQALKYVPGNKSLVLFSGWNLGSSATILGKEFASSSTPVYTINTKNWIEKGVLTLSIKEKFIWTDHPLKELALVSGGKYFADVKDVEAISRDVQALTGNFYVLGYYVNESWDEKYHQIKVEVKKPSLQVLAQDGYFNTKPFAKFTDFEKQLHLSDLLFTERPATVNPLDIPVEPLFIAVGEGVNLVLLAQISVDEKAGVPPAKVDIFSYIFNKDREVVLAKQREFDLIPYAQKSLYPYFMTRLPPGEYEYRIVALDKETGQSALGKVAFLLPEKTDTGILLSSPLLFAKGQESQIFNIAAEKKKKSSQGISLNDIYKFIPKNHSLVIRDLDPGIRSLLAVLPVTTAKVLASEIEFNVRLQSHQEGEPIDLEAEIIDFKEINESSDILILAISLPELRPGEYEMEIEAKEKEIISSSIVKKLLIIK